MLKAFILFLIFESTPGTVAMHSVEFATRQSCEAAKVSIAAIAKQVKVTPSASSAPAATEGLRIVSATCIER